MFKKFIILIVCIELLTLISCKNNIDIDTSNIFSYEYDFEHYGIENNSNFKASTVAGLTYVLNNNKTSIFMISSPLCSGCINSIKILNELLLEKDIIIYNIDTYSDIYPVFGDASFDDLMNILKLIGINNEEEIVLPIILVINNGNIDYYLDGETLHSSNNEEIIDNISNLLQKSLLY